MRARRAAVAGALLGLFASVYLLVDYLGRPLICLTGSGYDEVRLSPFGRHGPRRAADCLQALRPCRHVPDGRVRPSAPERS